MIRAMGDDMPREASLALRLELRRGKRNLIWTPTPLSWVWHEKVAEGTCQAAMN